MQEKYVISISFEVSIGERIVEITLGFHLLFETILLELVRSEHHSISILEAYFLHVFHQRTSLA